MSKPSEKDIHIIQHLGLFVEEIVSKSHHTAPKGNRGYITKIPRYRPGFIFWIDGDDFGHFFKEITTFKCSAYEGLKKRKLLKLIDVNDK